MTIEELGNVNDQLIVKEGDLHQLSNKVNQLEYERDEQECIIADFQEKLAHNQKLVQEFNCEIRRTTNTNGEENHTNGKCVCVCARACANQTIV